MWCEAFRRNVLEKPFQSKIKAKQKDFYFPKFATLVFMLIARVFPVFKIFNRSRLLSIVFLNSHRLFPSGKILCRSRQSVTHLVAFVSLKTRFGVLKREKSCHEARQQRPAVGFHKRCQIIFATLNQHNFYRQTIVQNDGAT